MQPRYATALRHRILDDEPLADLEEYRSLGGGLGLRTALRFAPDEVIEEVEASGLRGRGGAGFPTGMKWRAVSSFSRGATPPSVVVNGAEGEPGSFKDRLLLRTNPYRVLEGALIAAHAMGASELVVALKASFEAESWRVRRALHEMRGAGWLHELSARVVEGPDAYLFGEETGLLEVIAGRHPFPRTVPPYRQGLEDGSDASTATAPMATESSATATPPVLVNNVETYANIPLVLARGPDLYRQRGTDRSPGTVLCTVSGDTRRAGVVEVPMGTPLRDVIQRAAGGPRQGRHLRAVLPGVANAVVTEEDLGVPVSYEGFDAIGSGLGAGAFLVFDDATDPVAVAAGVARFLAIESCGQCAPCKDDGLAIAETLVSVRSSEGSALDLVDVSERLGTVTRGARCFLAHQTQAAVGSLLAAFPEAFERHVAASAPAVEERLIAPIVELEDGVAELDPSHLDKRPDWSTGDRGSGKYPVERLTTLRV